jgi:hypothetical protein
MGCEITAAMPTFITYRSVIPKNRQRRRPAAVPKGTRRNIDATALVEHRKP